LTYKDKAFIKRPTQKERENGLPNQFIISDKLWSITANVVLASIWSPSNSCLFGTYLSNRLWYTSKFPVWQNSLKYLMSFLKCLLNTTSFRKKLLARSKLRGAEDLGPWIKAICNHLWWCWSNSSGNKEWLEESFILSKRYSIHLRKPSTSILQELPVSVTLMVTNVSMCWLSMSSKE
jgi:hypothetical protein